ncbi:MAG: cupin domain-containing protein [Candidatus Rokubacteria bacterium]|nr:cupin domain-containing protein [Candidatus Rokubacteria bacterium]
MKITVKDQVKLQPDRMAKIALATTPRAQLDLYCLAPGQSQRAHVHGDQDKICYVVEGRGRFSVDAAEDILEPGDAIVARAGAAHGITNDGPDRLVVLVVVTPPPAHA